MNFYEQLQAETQAERDYLIQSAIIQDALNGRLSLQQYVAFLNQAYHHVKHTTPLLMATGSRLGADKEWLREAIAEYIEEELGHQEWVLNDIAACGYDANRARRSHPDAATELMVAYAYHQIDRVNPVAFFGMVQVLEGTSVALATTAADVIKQSLQLPDAAFSYLTSHGSLDQDHIVFFADLVNRLSADDQACVLAAAKMFYRLYAAIFRELDPANAARIALEAQA